MTTQQVRDQWEKFNARKCTVENFDHQYVLGLEVRVAELQDECNNLVKENAELHEICDNAARAVSKATELIGPAEDWDHRCV